MKLNLKSVHSGLKGLLCGGLLVASLNSMAQQTAVTLDPKLGSLKVTDLAGNAINENFIQPGQLVKLVLPIASVNQNQAIPKGSCKVKIGLGSKLTVDPAFDLTTMNSSNYFAWSVTTNGGQSQLTGELKNALPAGFQQVEVDFKVLGNRLGHSTITANFLITNHNTSTILSDNDGSNNSSFLGYEVTSAKAPTPVTTIDEVVKSDCSFNLTFSTDRELDLNFYTVEVSKNGLDYEKAYQVNAKGLASYNADIAIPATLQASTIVYVRVKSTFKSGDVLYSGAKSISGLCSGNWAVVMYPNPALSFSDVMIKAVKGTFNSKYTLTVVDQTGKVLDTKQMELNNVVSFKYRLGGWAAGKYMLKLANKDGSQSTVLHFEKL